MKKSQGYFLIFVLVFASVSVLALTGLVSFANTNLLAGRRAIKSAQAFQIAEAGIEYYRWHLAHAPADYADGGGAFPHTHNFYDKDGRLLGAFALTVTAPPELAVKSVGTIASDSSVKRTISASYSAGEGIIFRYGVQSGTGGFVLSNNASVEGNVYSNADITGGNGSSISGSASAVGSVTNVRAGQVQTGISPLSFPITDAEIAGWKNDASASTFTGNKTISGVSNTLGPIKIIGNLTVTGSLTVNDTIWITGNLVLGNGASISLAPSYGAAGGIVIADGTIVLGNSASLSGSGNASSSLMLITTSNSALAISLGNGDSVSSLILYAPNGTISIGNNADIQALAAKTITLGNNVDLEYKAGAISPSFISGPSGGWRLEAWKEIR